MLCFREHIINTNHDCDEKYIKKMAEVLTKLYRECIDIDLAMKHI